jgi:hypothetical protein
METISPPATRPSTIAFIEAGTADGGSTSWLLSALKYLDRRRFEPLIIFYGGIHLTQVTTISCGQIRPVLAALTIDV